MAKRSKEEKQVYGDFVCRECGNNSFSIVQAIEPTDFAGMLADGRRFTRVIRHRVQCSGCHQPSHLLRWEFDPAAWKE